MMTVYVDLRRAFPSVIYHTIFYIFHDMSGTKMPSDDEDSHSSNMVFLSATMIIQHCFSAAAALGVAGEREGISTAIWSMVERKH